MVVLISCLLWKLTRSSRRDARGRTEDGGRTVDRKGLDRGRDRDQAREARKEGESEIEMTQDEGKEGGS